jgi:hypothetical protein
VQAIIEIEESPYTFLVSDVVEIMGYGVGEKGKLVAHKKVMNVQGGTVHGVPIYEGCVSVDINKSKDDEYVLFRSVEMNDPPIRKIGEVVGHFIMWPTKFLCPSYVQL